MLQKLLAGAVAFAMTTGFALAQDTETTSTSHAAGSTTTGSQPASTGKKAKSGSESYEYSVDSTTVTGPVARPPSTVEKTTTTTTTALPPPMVKDTTKTTSTTTETQ